MVPGFKAVRFKFTKTDEAKFTSHLDLNRTMKSAIMRSGFEIEFSHGFNPHPKLRFSLPLSVGTESVCEYLDVAAREEYDCDELKKLLDENLPEKICITDCYTPDSDFSDICYARYEIKLISPKIDEKFIENLKKLFENEVIIEKRTKKTKTGVMDYNISPYIKEFNITVEECGIIIDALLSATTDNYINPDYILQAMDKHLGIDFKDPRTELYSAKRVNVYFEDLKEFK